MKIPMTRSEVGRLGWAARAARRTPAQLRRDLSKWGKLGGHPRNRTLAEIEAEERLHAGRKKSRSGAARP